jgi:hypothetical protein
MSNSSQDALRFVAKRRVMILGYGATGPKASEHAANLFGWSHKVSYKVNGQAETEKCVFTAETSAEIEGALVNMFDVYFADIGLPTCEL